MTSDGGSGGDGGSSTGGKRTSGTGGNSGSGAAPTGGSSGTGGSGTGGGPDAGTAPDLSGLPAKLAQAACDALSQCYGTGITSVLNGNSCLEFETAAAENSTVTLLAAAIAQGRIVDSSGDVDTCLAALKADCHLIDGDSICPNFFAGKVKAGEACSFNDECEKGLFCKWGATCPGTCEARLPLNAVCRWSSDCEEQLRCDDDTSTCLAEYVIDVTAASGDTCDPGNLKICQSGLSCAFTSISGAAPVFTCETPLTGGACHVGAPEECPSGQFCALTASGSAAGTCQAAPKVGEPCGKINPARDGSACEKGSVCDTGSLRCVALAANGGFCTANDQCYSKNCHNGTCMVQKCAP
jgi:hypothetical protein